LRHIFWNVFHVLVTYLTIFLIFPAFQADNCSHIQH